MKYHFPKRLLSAALTLALLAGLLCTSAFAAATYVDATEITPTGGTGSDGKITVTVYDNNPSTAVGDGDKIENQQGTLVNGVGINALCIGSVVELTTTDEKKNVTTQVAFGLDETIMDKLGLNADSAIATDTTTTYYFAPETVQNQLEDTTIQSQVEAYLNGTNKPDGTVTKVTGDDPDTTGVATFDGLDYGLYLLAKSKLPAEATTDFAPFLVSVPMYVEGTAGVAGTWNKDVYAYPKVRTGEIENQKTVDDGDGETYASGDRYVNAGQTLNFTITETIPKSNAMENVNSANNFTKFEITDTNAKKTLDIQTDTLEVKLGTTKLKGADEKTYNGAGSETQKTYDYYYTYADSISTPAQSVLTITLTETGLSKLNEDMTAAQTLTVTYSATVATDVNFESNLENTALLTYRRAGMPTTVDDAETDPSSVNLYTYGIDLTKTLSDASDKIGADQITFELYKAGESETFEDATKVPVTVANGVYWQAAATGQTTTMAVASAETNSSHLYLYGLEPGTYYLKETATQTGYTLLDKPIEIVITAPENPDTSNDPTAKVNGAEATVSAQKLVQLSVTNTKLTAGFQLPQTGGEGTLLVTAIGLGLLCAAVVLLVVYRKKSRN